jgi:hypothetical protein
MIQRLSGFAPPPEKPDSLRNAILRSLESPGILSALALGFLLVDPRSLSFRWVVQSVIFMLLLFAISAIPFVFFASLSWWTRAARRR